MSDKARFFTFTTLQQQLPIFFQPWWLDCVSDNWDVALAEENGIVKGVWPYSIDRKLGLRIIRNPLLTPYLGPYFLPDTGHTEAADTTGLLEQLWRQLPRYDSFDMETITEFTEVQYLLDKGFQQEEKITYEIGLQPGEEQLLAAMHSNHRNLIKQAAQCHKVLTGADYAPHLAGLHEATFHRKNKAYPFSPTLIHELIAESALRDQGCLWAAQDRQGTITAAIFTVWDRHKMYLLLSAADMEQVHPGAVRLLIWEAIKTARQKGLQQFDFEGSMDPGIAAFFRRFGGDRKTYLCLRHHRSLLWQLKKKLLG